MEVVFLYADEDNNELISPLLWVCGLWQHAFFLAHYAFEQFPQFLPIMLKKLPIMLLLFNLFSLNF